ncbi:hypothetical protein CU098_003323, partial [Rhizopus stolonifer]
KVLTKGQIAEAKSTDFIIYPDLKDKKDFNLDYVACLSRSSEFKLPSYISKSNKLLSVLSIILVLRVMDVANDQIKKDILINSDIRSILRRFRTLKKEDECVGSVKRNINIISLEDN